MKRESKKQSIVETPAIEIVVRSEEQELAVLAFFSDGSGGWDVVVGVGDPAQRGNLKAALLAAADAMGAAAFRPTRTIGHDGADYTPPF
jgi:hypothetical protein